MTAYTPGPWRQGRTLTTARTREWSAHSIAMNDAYERLRIFARFTADDEGRSRVLIATCERAEDARLIAKAPALLQLVREAIAVFDIPEDDTAIDIREWLESARAAVARIDGKDQP